MLPTDNKIWLHTSSNGTSRLIVGAGRHHRYSGCGLGHRHAGESDHEAVERDDYPHCDHARHAWGLSFRNNWVDIATIVTPGLIGYVMIRNDYSVIAFVFVLLVPVVAARSQEEHS